MAKLAWDACAERLERYIVRIATRDGYGTGFFLEAGPDGALVGIATAAHVVDSAREWGDPLKIFHPASGTTVLLTARERFIEVPRHSDVAAIVLPGGKIPFPELALPRTPDGHFLKVGLEIGWLGFPAIAPRQCFFRGGIGCWLEDEGKYLVDGVAINGVSGSPAVFPQEDGNLAVIGVLSAYRANRATGEALPGLSVIEGIQHLGQFVAALSTIAEARDKGTQPSEPTAQNPNDEVPPHAEEL